MSFNQFIVYGNPFFAETQHPESYYIAQRGLTDAYGLANAQVLQTLDGQINYADYDNWTFTPYNPNGHHPTPDGNVDLIIMFYRNSSYPGGGGGYNGSGIATLGYESDFVLDGKWIRFGFPGSGVTNGGGYAGQTFRRSVMNSDTCFSVPVILRTVSAHAIHLTTTVFTES